ncbi:MAG: murein hydrolase activator EnvC family protein [Beijerinckiaceae bacterium]
MRRTPAFARISLACAICCAPGLTTHAQAQTPPAPSATPETERRQQAIERSQQDLRGVEDEIRLTAEQRRKIEADVEMIRSDRARLSAALLQTTARVQALEAGVSEIERRLEASQSGEEAIRRSLEQRRDVIADILAALQRLGRRPPPAILISPDDALRAIRIAIMLGGLMPELRMEADALAADLTELVELRKRIAAERDQRRVELARLADERQRVSSIMEARRDAQALAERALGEQQERARTLARQALDLRELIARMEDETDGGRRAAEAARAAEAERKRLALARPQDRIQDSSRSLGEATRLAPAVAFAQARGLLPLPVSGEIRKAFGAPDGFGGSERGLSIATRPGALVASPADGWVAFSGPYRTYGQLLIINAGDGYYIVLAGMDRINVAVGQFVLAGEPVASMGEASGKTAAAIAIGAAQPVLYVEFRKDGAAIDPGPWWAKSEREKVRG